MAHSGAALLLMAVLPAAAILRGTSNNMDLELALGVMHPEQVGRLLQTVELKWEEARASSLRNLTDENVGLEDMVKSCSKVGMAIIAGSDGDKDKVVEYMNDVCATSESGEQCKTFASGIAGSMSDDEAYNRNELQLSGFCQNFWSGPVTGAAKVIAQKAEAEDAAKAQEEAKAEEEKTNKVLAATTEKESQAATEAVNKTAEAIQHASQVEEEIKNLETSMAAEADEASKALDAARQEQQVASEKEAKAAETQIAEDNSAAAANDDAEAMAAGDAVADRIADKALKKEAALVAAKPALVAAKQHKVAAEFNPPKKNLKTAAKKTAAPKKANATQKVTKNVTATKTNVTGTKNATKKVEVAKKF